METSSLQEEWFELSPGRRILIRPIEPGDEAAHQRFFSRLSPNDVMMRFFHPVHQLQPKELERLTHIDRSHEIAFIATEASPEGRAETLGVARMVVDADDASQAEFAVVVRSDLKRRGLGRILLAKMIRYSRERGLRAIHGAVLAENEPMLRLGASLGFHAVKTSYGVVEVRLDLSDSTPRSK